MSVIGVGMMTEVMVRFLLYILSNNYLAFEIVVTEYPVHMFCYCYSDFCSCFILFEGA